MPLIWGYSIGSYWLYGFILPIMSALAFIYVYPFAATHALGYTLNRQVIANALKRESSEHKLIDVARGRELVKENSQLKLQLEKMEIEAAEKEKSLTESINILELQNAILNDQVANNKIPSAIEISDADGDRVSKKFDGSSVSGIIGAIGQEREKQDANLTSQDPHGLVNDSKIRDSSFIWDEVANKVYAFHPHSEFKVSDLFDSEVWGEYTGVQRNIIEAIFHERYLNGDYVNIKHQGLDTNGSKSLYLTLPFSEYHGWQQIRDKLVSFLNSKKGVVFFDEIVPELGFRSEIVFGCLTYLTEKGYIEISIHHRQNQRAKGYKLTKSGRLYAEALGF